MTSQHLKTMLQDIINDRPEQAHASMHEYFVAKSRELTEHYPEIDHYPETDNKSGKSGKSGKSKPIGDDVWYAHKHISSLRNMPLKSSVVGNFFCHDNNLTSLEGAPSSVGGDFICDKNKLTSLKGAPSSIGNFFHCNHNNLTSLQDIHKYIKHIGYGADFQFNPIKSHVLGLFSIDGIRGVLLDNIKVQKIVNKHLKGDRDVNACQEELIDAGFEDFAQL